MFRTLLIGTASMSLVRVIRLMAQFVAVPILARLLSPAEYGLMALAMPFVLFAMMLADAGIGMSLVRVDAKDRTTWSSAFWASIGLGLVLALVMAASGPLAAWALDAPALAPMLAVLAMVVLAQAVHLIPVSALQQAGRFGTIAISDICSTAAGIATAVWMAYHGYGVWALVGQQVTYFMVRTSVSLITSPFQPTRQFSPPHLREHLTFGRNVLGANLVSYAGRNLDSWIVGKALGAALLGFYSMAFLFARLPAQLVTGPLQYVMYAEIARMKDRPEAIGRSLLLITQALSILLLPMMGAIAAAHEPIFALLLSSKWQLTGHLFMLLAFASAFQAIAAVGETIIYALGRADLQLRNASEYALLWLLTLAVAAPFGLQAAALAYSGITLLYLVRFLRRVLVLVGVSPWQYLRVIALPLLSTAIAVVAIRMMLAETSMNMLAQTACSALIACIAIAAAAAREWRHLKHQIAALLPAR